MHRDPGFDAALEDAIERPAAAWALDGGVRDLARVAGWCRRIPIAGPDAPAAARMEARFEALIAGRRHGGFRAWLGGWLGLGPRPRALTQRLAAGACLLAVAGGGSAAVAGAGPAAVGAVVRFTGNAFASLSPAGDPGTGSAPLPLVTATTTPEPDPDPSPVASPAPAPAESPVQPGALATPAASATVAPPQSTPGGASPAGATVLPALPPAPGTPGPSPTPTGATAPAGTATTKPAAPGSPPATSTPPPTAPPGASSATPLAPPGAPSATPQGPPPGVRTFPVLDAGGVALRRLGALLAVVETRTSPGWTATVAQANGVIVEVNFVRPGRRISFVATVENGQIVTRVRE